MKKWKKPMALFLAVMTLLWGCSGNGNTDAADGGKTGSQSAGQDGQQSQSEGGMGRYLESETDVSGLLSRPSGLVRRTDGSLAILDYDNGLIVSGDGGQSWEKEECGSFVQLAQENYMLASAHSPDGSTAAAYVSPENVGEGGEMKPTYLLIDSEGNQRELPIVCDEETGYLLRLWYMGEGMLYGQGFGRNVYQISETDGSMKKILDMRLVHMTAMGDKLLLTHQEGFTVYDPATGEQTEDAMLNDFLEKHIKDEDLLGNTGVYPLLVTDGGDEQTVCLTCRDGIYSHVLGGSLMEQAVDGSLSSFSDPRCGLVGMAVLDTGEILVLTLDSLFRYTYDPDMAAVPEKQLQVYSLKENLLLRQAITLYRKQHPEVYVNYTVGMDESGGVTREDALKTLNTQIAAGNSPDLLVLDDMPVDSYVEKGLLTDLSRWIAPMEEELFTNVTDMYRKDSAVYAVPVKFMIPMMLGDQDTVGAAGDMGVMADRIEALRGQFPTGKITAAYSAEEMLKLLGIYDSWRWLDETGKVDEAALETFFNEAKRCWQAEKAGLSDQSVGDHEGEMGAAYQETREGAVSLGHYAVSLGHYYDFFLYARTGATSYYIGEQRLTLGFLSDTGMDLGMIISAAKEVGQSEYGFWKGKDGMLFLPMVSVGISSSSAEQELAGELLLVLLSEENLKGDYTDGFPVNRKALAAQNVNQDEVMYSSYIVGEDGIQKQIMMEWPSEEECMRLTERIEELGCPMFAEGKLWDTVTEAGVKVLEGEITVSEGVQEVVKKTAIEMAE